MNQTVSHAGGHYIFLKRAPMTHSRANRKSICSNHFQGDGLFVCLGCLHLPGHWLPAAADVIVFGRPH